MSCEAKYEATPKTSSEMQISLRGGAQGDETPTRKKREDVERGLSPFSRPPSLLGKNERR